MDSACRRHGCRIISIILVLVCCLTPSLAADGGNSVYSVSSDSRAVSSDRSTGSWTAFDYGAVSSGAYIQRAITNNEEFWQYTNHSLARGLVDLYGKVDNVLSATNSINTLSSSINSSLTSINSNTGILPSVLSKLWGTPTSQYTIYHVDNSGNISSDSAQNIGQALSYSSLNGLYAGYWAKQNNDALWSLAGGLNTVNTGLGTINQNVLSGNSTLVSIESDLLNSSAAMGNFYFNDPNYSYLRLSNSPLYLLWGIDSNGRSVSTYSVPTSDISSLTLSDYLTYIQRTLFTQGTLLSTLNTVYSYDVFDTSTLQINSVPVTSVMDVISHGFSDLASGVNRLSYIFASDDDIQARQDADPQIQQAQDDFISSDGAASVKLGDMGSAKDVSAQMQQSLNTGVSPSTAFSYFGTNGGLFALFTQQIKNDMDAVPQTRGGEEIIDFYHANLEKIGVPFSDDN